MTRITQQTPPFSKADDCMLTYNQLFGPLVQPRARVIDNEHDLGFALSSLIFYSTAIAAAQYPETGIATQTKSSFVTDSPSACTLEMIRARLGQKG